jgi:periplasmic protein TonB
MFDAVLSRQQREQRYGAGVVIALLAYAAAIGAAVLILPQAKDASLTQDDVAVTLYTALEPAPPPPPPPGPATSNPEPSRPKPKVVKPIEKPIELPKPVVEPTPVDKTVAEPTPEPADPAPATDTAPEPPSGGGGVVGGVAGGVMGGVVGGTVGGTVGAHGTGTQVLPFGPGMTRPEQVAGTPPTYSRDALAARVEGKVLVRCVITIAGEVTNCQVIKGVPMLTEVVLASLAASRFTPVHYRGVPQAIQYLFTFNFKLP